MRKFWIQTLNFARAISMTISVIAAILGYLTADGDNFILSVQLVFIMGGGFAVTYYLDTTIYKLMKGKGKYFFH